MDKITSRNRTKKKGHNKKSAHRMLVPGGGKGKASLIPETRQPTKAIRKFAVNSATPIVTVNGREEVRSILPDGWPGSKDDINLPATAWIVWRFGRITVVVKANGSVNVNVVL